jgi:hypothetical protein
MKLSAHYETEAYMTAGGYYAIKQEDLLGGDPSLVLLKPEQLRALIKDMTAALDHPSLFEAEEGAE